MGCGDGGDAGARQPRDYRLRQRGAFLRVGACAHFIQQDQRAAVGVTQDANYVPHVRPECGYGFGDALRIANVGEHAGEHGQAASVVRRDLQPGLVHERRQAHRFHGYGFAAGVGAGDYERRPFAPESERQRHGVRAEKRVSRANQPDALADRRLRRVETTGVARAGEREVHLGDGGVGGANLVRRIADYGRQLAQNAPLLAPLFKRQLAPLVAQLDR